MKRKNVSGFVPPQAEQKLPLKTPGSLVLSSKESTKEKPNPASTWAAFNYNLKGENPTAMLQIIDANGKMVHQHALSGKQGQYVWDTRDVKSGVYVYIINASGITATGKLIVK